MAKTRIGGGSGGGITVAGVNLDFASYTYEIDQQVDDDSNYTIPGGGDSSCHGSGLNDHTITNAAGFASFGAASTQPFTDMDGEPIACVPTVATGCTYTGNYVPTGFRFDHKRRSGACPFSVKSLKGAGTIAVAWAVA